GATPGRKDRIPGLSPPRVRRGWPPFPPNPPGPMSATIGAILVKEEMTSFLSEDPTATAVEIQAGAPTALVNPSLPAAITVATPALRKLSMDGFVGSPSQAAVNIPPPRLILTEASLTPGAGVRAFIKSQSRADI